MITACAEAGHTVHYLSPEPFPLPGHAPTVIWHRAWVKGPQWLQKLQCALVLPFQVLWVCARHHIDRIAVFGSAYAAVSALSRCFLRIPIVTFIRSYWLEELRYRKVDGITRLTARIMDRLGLSCSRLIAPNSQALQKALIEGGTPPEKVTVLPNDIKANSGISKNAARQKIVTDLALPDNAFILAYIGTFKTMKRAWMAVEILNLLKDSRAHLIIAGDGVDRDRIEHTVARHGLGDRCHLLGWQDDPGSIYAAADITLLPSAFEGSPNAVLESLGANTPVLGATAPGIEEILPEELRFSPDDLPGAAQKLRDLIEDPKKRAQAQAVTEKLRKEYTFNWNARIVALITDLRPSDAGSQSGTTAVRT